LFKNLLQITIAIFHQVLVLFSQKPQPIIEFCMKYISMILLTVFLAASLQAQDSEEWNVTEHRANFTNVEFETTEGTWMNLDVSPDGEEIVFDLLGNIYVMPIDGGDATVIRESLAYEIQPRFSPDGSKISFTSDAGGGDNIWVMNSDGSDPRQITDESFRLLNNAFWTPDGNYLVARKHFTSGRSLGAGELWMYHITGGSGIQLTERPNDQQDLGQPFVSPDGRYVYYSQDVYPGGFFQYNKDPNSQIYVINRYDREDGDIERVTGGPGGAISPTISPDGSHLAFIKRVRTKSVLYIRNLETGIEKPVFDQMSQDQQQAWAIFGPYTNFNWTPDGTHLVFWAQGGIHKLNVETLDVEEIPFTAQVRHELADVVKFEFDPAPETFTAKAIRHAVTSPDGNTLVFNTAGYLWKKELPNGNPVRLTTEQNLEFEPAFSPDGSTLVYVTWSDDALGSIKTLNMDGQEVNPVKITSLKGIYRQPSFSPDGEMIVFRRESGNNHQGHAYTQNPGIYIMSVDGGEITKIADGGSNPIFDATGERIFYQARTNFRSVDLNGQDEKQHFRSEYAINFTPSPDNQWIAFTELYKVYIAPMPQVGSDIDLSSGTKAIPVTHVARDAGYNLHWTNDGKELRWTLGEKYYSVDLNDAFDFLNGDSDDDLPLGDSEGISIGLELETDIPSGVTAFTNARIITMDGEEVIQNGTLVVRDNRIESVGSSEDVAIPESAYVVDASGHTIMPGLVDAHAHIGNFREGLSPNQQWEYFANLGYGVTTAHDPSSNTEMIFSQSEMVRAGNMIGPRIYSTGRILYGAENIQKTVVNNLDDARSAVLRTQAFGATSVKSYNQPRRDQRQQILEAARELGVNVVPEGGSTFTHNMSMILDGHTGIEHNVPIYPLYNDVLTLWASSNVGYTPTLVVNYGSMSGEYYWYQHTNVWEKKRLLTFTPRGVVDSRSRHRTMVPEEEYEAGHFKSAAAAKDLHDLGVTVNIGAHGQLQGLAAHWETWMFTQGGMSNHDALKVATINGANYIGLGDHIGSLEEGKLADLIVIDGNPLEDIYDTENVVYTMINGRLYDASTMNEIGNHPNERLPFWWEREGYSEQFDWHSASEADAHGHHVH
jgi:imidazolonepropionase-like amidohydrolase/Tol biopolymer transport system component